MGGVVQCRTAASQAGHTGFDPFNRSILAGTRRFDPLLLNVTGCNFPTAGPNGHLILVAPGFAGTQADVDPEEVFRESSLAAIAAAVFLIFQATGDRALKTQGRAPLAVLPVKTPRRSTHQDGARTALRIGNVEPYTKVFGSKERATGSSGPCGSRKATRCGKARCCSRSTPALLPPPETGAGESAQGQGMARSRPSQQEKRYKDLLGKNFISPDAYEQVRTNAETAAATVSADEAAIEIESCRSILHDSRAGDRLRGPHQIQQGNLVKATRHQPMVTINQVVPILRRFRCREQNIADVRKVSGGWRAQGSGELRQLRVTARGGKYRSSTTRPMRHRDRSSSRRSFRNR